MRIMSIHAHFDDFEFCGAGLFEKWRRTDSNLKAKVVVCTNGEAGHHFRTRKETGELRRKEQQASAEIGKYELEFLRKPNGEYPREGCLIVDIPLLSALWKSIRDFKPDFIFCPPFTTNAIAGIHIDHMAVADAVRKVAYMINVPHCFTPEYPEEEGKEAESIRSPIIINYFDNYIRSANDIDFAVNISDEFEAKAEMAWCHRSQIKEWLPWVNHTPEGTVPETLADYTEYYRRIYHKRNKFFDIKSDNLYEFFTVTAWGRKPPFDAIAGVIPGIDPNIFPMDKLREKLDKLSL